MVNYIRPKEFRDLCDNQDKLIVLLNHRMTGIESAVNSMKIDVGWLKKLLWVIVGMIGMTFASAISIIMGG